MPTARTAATSAAKKSTATAAKSTSRAAAKPAAAVKPAAKPAAKAAPATASRRGRAAAPAEEDIDLLAGLNDESAASTADDDDDFDLLSDLSEDGGTPWYPWDDEDQPDGIQGTVKYIGEVEREQKFGGGMAPYVEVQDRADPELIWAVRGYATVLGNQLNRQIEAGLKAGDTIAIKYFGEKENRKGDNSYKNFKVVVRSS